jgi:hypothetical protein
MQFDLFQEEPDCFRCRDADPGKDARRRLLQLGFDAGVNHPGFYSLLSHTRLLV